MSRAYPFSSFGSVARVERAVQLLYISCCADTVDARDCECKAAQDGRPCWHRAAWRLLRKAAEMVQPARVMPTEAEPQALVDELFA